MSGRGSRCANVDLITHATITSSQLFTGNQTLPFIQEVTTKNTTTNETITNNSTKMEEAKGRALNFTIHDLNSSMQKLNKHKDLSDVSMDDDEEIDVEDHDSLDSKHFPQNTSALLGILYPLERFLSS